MWILSKTKKIFIYLIFSFFAFSAFAGNFIENLDFSFSPQAGLVTTNYNEKYYLECNDEIRQMSLLDWNINCAPCFSIDSSISMNRYFIINFSGNYVLPFSTGFMQDFDWINRLPELGGTNELTHFSWHENELNAMYNFDYSIGIYPLISQVFTLETDFLYSYDFYSFSSYNGYKQYSSQNEDGSYNPWNESIPKVDMYGSIIDYKGYGNSFGLGFKCFYNSDDKLTLCAGEDILFAFKSLSLDKHMYNNNLVLYHNEGKLYLKSKLSASYKINKNSYIYVKTQFIYTEKKLSAISEKNHKGGETSFTLYATVGYKFCYGK